MPFKFDNYKDNTTGEQSLPYTMIVTPRERGNPFGFGIPADSAAEVEFSVPENWTINEIYFGDNPEPVELIMPKLEIQDRDQSRVQVSEYVRMSVVKMSPTLVQARKSKDDRWQTVNYHTRNGVLTSEGIKAEYSEDKNHRKINRLAFYLLDENNQLLHTRPFSLTLRGAFRGSFWDCFIKTQRAADEAFFASAKKQGVNLKGSRLKDLEPLKILAVRISLNKSKNYAAYICTISDVQMPATESKPVTRKTEGGAIAQRSHWESLFIEKDSEVGQKLLETAQELKSWGQLPGDRANPSSSEQGATFEEAWDNATPDTPQGLASETGPSSVLIPGEDGDLDDIIF